MTEWNDIYLEPIVYATLYGYIYDTDTNAPISGAYVELWGWYGGNYTYTTEYCGGWDYTYTDENGYYELSVQEGYYELYVYATDYYHYYEYDIYITGETQKDIST